MIATPSRRELFRLAGLGLGSLMLPGAAWAAEEEPLAHIDPELRDMARMWLKARKAAPPGSPPNAVPPRPKVPQGIIERMLPGRNGAPPVPVYLVDGRKPGAPPTGAILYMHGGGFIYRSALEDIAMLQAMATRLNCLIVTVEYRLAPAATYAGSIEDNYAGLKWLHDNAASLNVDPARITLIGISAGGGHAAMLAIAARDRGEVPVAFQMLVYPMLDDRTGSARAVPPHIGTIVWDSSDNRRGWSAFLGQPAGLRKAPLAAVPARVENLAGLPPAFIGVGGIDLFVDEDITYARRLNNAGVPTELLVVPGAYHAFDLVLPKARVSQQFSQAIDNALVRALAPK